ncbi:DNA polymerase III subunit beta [Kingella negevensis]|uniref:DNA polymerase III subunit beta n=1 Tax=Kingella negevensis TaxID=1522312 RepID=UPI002549F4DF|nr:DNA polymerase III subunit beta [Kingella negevensis]MDK4679288.1 DNA polymerase III subunit beta [Kingella negevensis]MDK4682990.1 DNA polymerase III subunit beta [Kingella negevensis]MDK4691190.1 DNA polymerase III subunit beta [Kingella negevensis]MDK4693662.1 DNA polymerase III subunit beta [Kingella negevensis]MDK4700478.1 DNA polymerase III subunit beta [Kingella negevensis]
MLILQTPRDSLLKPLQAATGIVERKHTLPILSNVLLESKNGKIHILATDLEIQIHTQGADNDKGDFRITTNAKKLQDILRALPESADVQLDWADHKLTLKAGKSRFNLQTLPAEDFPTMSVGEKTQAAFSLTQEAFKNMISQVQYSMAVQDIRYYLNGLLMQVEGNQLRLVATDGHRLAFSATEINADLPKTEVILPRKTVLELNKLLNQSKENISVELLDNQVRFQCNDTVIVSKVIDGKFPDYNRVIPMDNDKIFMISRTALLSALERSAILANEKFRGVRLQLSAGSLKVSCSNNEQEEATEELEIAYQGEELEVGFNIQFLMDVLRSINCEDMQLAFGDASRSTLFTIPNEANFKYIVMPMRI